MKKCYALQNIDCANCAAKIERAIAALPEVENANLVFATRQLYITAEDPDRLLTQMQQIADRIEPGCTIAEPEHSHSHGHDHGHFQDCCCGQEHKQAHAHTHEHTLDHSHEGGSLKQLLIGTVLFAVGLLLQLWHPLAGLAAYIAAYLVLGLQVLITAGKHLLRGQVFDENFLMGIATLGAFAIGEYPEAVGIMLFYCLGEYFQEKAVQRSRRQILEAADLRPDTVILASGETVPAESAKPGDLLLVRPGDRIPLDGVVFQGSSQLDTAPITGEPVPVVVHPGDSVISGCINTLGELIVRAEKPLRESMVTRILQAMESAAAGKPKIDRFITRFARIYTPIVVLAAAATAVIPSLFTGNWNYWLYTAISFLVMSCPCALVLSVPLAFFSGMGAGSKKGILFKDGISMEALAGIKVVAMDKTGTLTKGDFRVQQVHGEVLSLCAACEAASSHPIAQSILSFAKEQGVSIPHGALLEEIPGHGIRGQAEGKQILCGTKALLERFHVEIPHLSPEEGTAVLVAVDGVYAGRILLSDTVKPEAAQAVALLHKKNISTALLTGDREASAQAVGRKLGIRQVFARLLPQQKLDVVRALREEHGAVMFVGDGINDAPVLAGADVGAAMGSGADAAIEAADVVFLTSRANAIPEALAISSATKAIAWQNVVFALGVKLIVMILGFLGFAQLWLAVFADTGVAILCVLNSIRLLYRK